MLIVGAKGLAKEILNILDQKNQLDDLYFFDDLSDDLPTLLYDRFVVLRDMHQVLDLFRRNNSFTIGIGNPSARKGMFEKFSEAGGEVQSVISPLASVGRFGTAIGRGSIIMAGTVITNSVVIGDGCLINPNCTVSHDSIIGDFVEISPGVQITGNCQIARLCKIGTNATVLPKIKLGVAAIIGAGAVVTKNVPDNTTVVGVPAKPMYQV